MLSVIQFIYSIKDRIILRLRETNCGCQFVILTQSLREGVLERCKILQPILTIIELRLEHATFKTQSCTYNYVPKCYVLQPCVATYLTGADL